MKYPIALFALVTLCATVSAEDKNLFNGKDLTGWKGLDFWSVKDGAITGQTTKEHSTKGNTFYKIVDLNGKSDAFGNSGIQYRSKVVDEKGFVVAGYQGDFECGKAYSGILYEEKGRGILAKRGEKVVIHEGKDAKKPKLEVTGSVGKSDEIQAKIKAADWNEYRIVAQGGHLQHFINGVQTIDVTDETAVGAKKGVLALQLHAGTAMTVQFKDIILKEIK
ncbi:MAG: DUF1080 domain-containing protein [Verrucomicrobia bacterium]|nr:DUF1080 domain-containing protein [Verrucomicrobiota bacterium]